MQNSQTNLNGLQIPNHLGVIIDGNRRYGKLHGMRAWESHRKGAETLENFFQWCLDLNIPQLSVYTLSSENFENRPKKEINEILNLYYKYLKKWEKKKKGNIFDKYEIRVRFVGDLSNLPPKLVNLMGKLMHKTAKYQKKVLNLMINYGGQFEITEAVKKIAQQAIKIGKVEVTAKDIERNLLVPVPIDLLIRTGGYSRISNFMIWQAAYVEIYFTKTLWPAFTKEELIKAIKWFNKVQRNYGK